MPDLRTSFDSLIVPKERGNHSKAGRREVVNGTNNVFACISPLVHHYVTINMNSNWVTKATNKNGYTDQTLVDETYQLTRNMAT